MEEINAWGAYETGTAQNARSLGRSAVAVRPSGGRGVPPEDANDPPRRNFFHGGLRAGVDVEVDAALATAPAPRRVLFLGEEDAAAAHRRPTSAEEVVAATGRSSSGGGDVATASKEANDDVAVGTEPSGRGGGDIEEAAMAAVPKEGDHRIDEPNNNEGKDEMRDAARDAFRVYFSMSSSDDPSSGIDRTTTTTRKDTNFLARINGTMPHLTGYLSSSSTKKKLPGPTIIAGVVRFVEASFRGLAQVYFQNNPLAGVLILAAAFVQSSRVAVHGVVGVVAGNLAGVLMGFDKSLLSSGLFGYNSFLVGLALATFYGPEERRDGYYWPVAVGSIIFAYFSSVLFVMLGKILSPYKTPPFTLPFNISTIVFLLAMGGMNNVDMAPVREPELPSYDAQPVANLTARDFFVGAIRGIGQVYLLNDVVAGILVLVGIMICSRISALAALAGSVVGTGVAAFVGCSRDAIANGMYGFNPSLTMTAVMMFYVPSSGSITVGIVASAITVFIQLALETSLATTGLPVMTLPFCLAALAFIVIQGTTASVISVPLSSMTTPEDHLKRVSRLSDGFQLLYGAIRSSSYKGGHRWSSHNINKSTRRISSALNDYDETVHGGTEKLGIFSRAAHCCRTRNDSALTIGHNTAQLKQLGANFRMRFAMNNSMFLDEEKESFARMFRYIDSANNYEISKEQFKQFLQSVGLVDAVGLDFACEAFQLMDLDGSGGDIDVDKFIAFAKISRHMPYIRRLIVRFFDFVDVNGDRSVELSELDGARSYLGLPPMSDKDRDSLLDLCDENQVLEFEEIVQFVTIFKLKSIVKEYQSKRQEGHSLDRSIRSSIGDGI